MKKQVLRYLLAIVGVVLLIGLIASCGKDEPRFKVIESMAYTEATRDSVSATLTSKHLGGMKRVENEETLWNQQYSTDVRKLIGEELQKKNPSYGLILIVKADNYRIRYNTTWRTKPDFTGSYSIWQ
jgi:hypothetical protein